MIGLFAAMRPPGGSRIVALYGMRCNSIVKCFARDMFAGNFLKKIYTHY